VSFLSRPDRPNRLRSRIMTPNPAAGYTPPPPERAPALSSPLDPETRQRLIQQLGPRPRHYRVLVAEDSPATRQALVELLEDCEDLHLVAAVGDADQAVAQAAHLQPDVALLDVRMPGGGGLAAARGIQQVSPATRLVAYSAASDRGSVVQMLRSGVRGYLLKGASTDELLEGLRRCGAGETALSAQLHAHLITEMSELGRQEQASAEAAQARYERIHRLLDPGGMAPVYQPIVYLADARVAGYEALARFAKESPGAEDLFREAHEVGLGVDLELHAARLAVADFKAELATHPDRYLAVNASPGLLYRQELLEVLADLPPAQVVVEITEQRQFESYDQLRSTVALVHERGMRVAVDDAGSGFAGLQRLVDVRPEIVKLDRGLVTHIDGDPSRRALVTAMRRFADDVGIIVVAEGIERHEELLVLRDIGIDCGQGYLFGRPRLRRD
jgi:EAL domain-containing protein (putative c-di-GMP-specific phosphodiesterase class I)